MIAQTYQFSGTVLDGVAGNAIPQAHIIIVENGNLIVSDADGSFESKLLATGTYRLEVSFVGYENKTIEVQLLEKDLELTIYLEPSVELMAKIDLIEDGKKERSLITRLNKVEGTAIYAGKKNEVIRMDGGAANLSTNNSRQIYSSVPGLNIWESDATGLQLEIGARGLSPKRTSNFNTRQNGYDISADALGYPESYYTPPSEAIEKIELVRGAASLQYGTQFGGMLNFVMKKGDPDKKFALVSRQTLGSFGLFNSFNSVGGQKGKWNYYAFHQYKRADGFRPNSSLDAHTSYMAVRYLASDNFNIGLEYTRLDYLAQQPGGLTDAEFEIDPTQSKRSRNWFRVNWNVLAMDLNWRLSPLTQLNSRTFGLLASRDALGVLERIDWDENDLPQERNLIKSDFKNWGNETRLVHRYMIGDEFSAFLTGFRIYRGDTEKNQGLGSVNSDADFNFVSQEQNEGSFYSFPSTNVSLFVENLFRVNEKLSITPGARLEYIRTEANGFVQVDVNDQIEKVSNQRSSERNVFLFGLGISYMWKDKLESYVNYSKNYRAINFNDMEIINPSVVIDPDLKDEEGFNIDLGLRGEFQGCLDFDISVFYLDYSDRIGFVQRYYGPEAPFPYTSYRFRTNVADSRTIGMESYASIEYFSLRGKRKEDRYVKLFANVSLQSGQYTNTDEVTVQGKKVESVPDVLMKYGVLFGYKKWSGSLLYSYTGAQFADAQNTQTPTPNALFGEIPSYSVMDVSLKYDLGKWQFETGVNNLLDQSYFTRRADGYPGPGIVPSQARSVYLTLQLSL